MARQNQQTFAKRQREQKRAEKARQKLEKRELRKDPDAPPIGTGYVVPLDSDVEAEDGGGNDQARLD